MKTRFPVPPPRRFGRAWRLICFHLLPSAFCLLPSAFCLLPSAFCLSAPPLELRGLLVAVEQANLSSRSAGVIKTIKNEGDRVRVGDIVVQLEDDAERAVVDQQRALLKLRQSQADSSAKLRKNNATSEEDARTAQANLETAQAQLRQAEAALEKKSLHSPIDGIVTKRIRAPGEAVDQYLPVLNVVNPARLWLETFVPAARLGDLRAGEPVEVQSPEMLPGRTFSGQVEFIAPNVDPASGETRLKVLIANDVDAALRPGMSAVGRIGLNVPEPRSGSAAR